MLPSAPPIIKVDRLSKSFGDIHAVRDLSFSVNQGDIYGFLGQNGAGKSTTIRMLLTLIRPDAGEIELLGMNLRSHRKEILMQVGAVIERPDLYKYLTAYENLSLFARMSGLSVSRKRLMEQLEQVGLAERASYKVNTFSQGMKQRLGIGVALVNDPKLVILDEPTNGLDPQGIADIRNLILHLSRGRGKTVLVSSHLLSEMELIAGRMLIMDRGKKIVEGRVEELFDPAETVVELDTADPSGALEWIMHSPWQAFFREQRQQQLIFKMDKTKIPDFTAGLVQQGVRVMGIRQRHSLEDYFLSLTTANQHVETFTDRTI
jgi:ABC-2 type transport system ATP-binding protein